MYKELEAQFLCCHNLSLINFSKLTDNLTWENQKCLLEATINNKLNCEKPIRVKYQLSFLRKLIEHLELGACEIHDDVYEKYCELQSIHEDNFSFKHYLIPNNVISLKESKNFVSNGTTGLYTWQASLALSNWILNNVEIFVNKNIMELGCGTGLCGITTAKCSKFMKLLLTDGSHKVIELLRENLMNNFPNAIFNKDGTLNLKLNDFPKIESILLPWESIEELKLAEKLIPDIILAADVVYDNSVFSALANVFEYMTRLNSNCLIILACTVRNEITLDEFLKYLGENDFLISQQNYKSESIFFHWDNNTPINIYIINKKLK